ncbi:ArsR/SmtB family transcription factor [Devosia aquimaris]|uniref:ArsR/SmtB family transcription factor n=1 Tax=Devosia aquimaris TaxID=2866214 RepID=UPI001CD0703F|nr:metalloregulator ArsR/SmtB family transcription factor [Devosia sp. CJK-A8-3]
MEQFSHSLDSIFQALADPTRRAVLERLGHGPASVGELAMPFDMALPSFMKHITMLESCGLIRTRKSGRVRHCAIDPQRLALVDGWLADQRTLWNGRTDRLERLLTQPKDKDPSA